MSIVAVGGSEHGVGKTSLVCGLIAAFPDCDWIAAKITSHIYAGVERIFEETAAGEATDTSRYLAAGAKKSFLISADSDAELNAALDILWSRVGHSANVIFESNRVVAFVNPDICLMVAGGSEPKASFLPAAARADAIVVNGPAEREPLATTVSAGRTRRVFQCGCFNPLPAELKEWIHGRLIYR